MIKKDDNLNKPPVVVIMGHVDAGKTSILDYIREAKVVEDEAGGITQHVGSYQVEHNNKKITFIDTPGHEAFYAMRLRGSKLANIAILVVDAVSGVQSQTKEAIKHIKKADIQMIVVANKIDRRESNIEKLKINLMESDVIVEEMGGEIPLIKTSAKTGRGIDELLEMILLIAELQELPKDLHCSVKGIVIESYLDKKKGPLSTILIQGGILREGDIIATHSAYGKIKRMEAFNNIHHKEFFPADPVTVYGFQTPPQVGEEFSIFENIIIARDFVEKNQKEKNLIRLKNKEKMLEIDDNKKVLNVIIKSDVIGTIEAIETILLAIPQDKIHLNILEIAVGEVNESDVKKAIASNAHIFAFNVKVNPIALYLLEKEKMKINEVNIIYRIVEQIKFLMEKMLKPEKIKIEIGKLRVTVVFKSEKNKQIVGGRVIDGEIKKGYNVDVIRKNEIENEIIEEGKASTIQKNRKEVSTAKKRDEVAVMYRGRKTIKEGDYLSFFKIEKRKIEL